MISLIKATKPYRLDLGDFMLQWFNPDAIKYINAAPSKPLEGQVLNLSFVHMNFWRALDALNINADKIKTIYECPYTGYRFFALMPVAVISDDLKKKYDHVDHWNKNYLFDHKFHKKLLKNKIYELNETSELMFGSGYTTMTGANDGSRGVFEGCVSLDNGDKLLIKTWLWYNK